jgi:hypothetical protein
LAPRCNFHYVDERLSRYRYHGEQVTTLRVAQMLDVAIEVQQRVMRFPEYSRVSDHDRARVYCTHGVKHALRRRTSMARLYFWNATQTKPSYLMGHALLAISLLGGGILRQAIAIRRWLAGNHIEGRALRMTAGRRAAALKKSQAAKASPVGAGSAASGREVVHQ